MLSFGLSKLHDLARNTKLMKSNFKVQVEYKCESGFNSNPLGIDSIENILQNWPQNRSQRQFLRQSIKIIELKIIVYKMNKITELFLKKSRSSYEKNKTIREANPQQRQHTIRGESHVQEMILQKYNFSHRFKTNQCQRQSKYQHLNKTTSIPCSNVIAVSQFPKIEQCNSMNSEQSLFGANKIRQKQKQNSIENCDYVSVHAPTRNVTDYKDCIRRIQMKTTYRGFNSTQNKFHNKNNSSQNDKKQLGRDSEISKTPSMGVQRKRIIQYIIEKGFAKKMEDSLIKARNERKKVHKELVSTRNTSVISPFKTRKSVVFSQTESLPVGKGLSQKKMVGLQHSIEPW